MKITELQIGDCVAYRGNYVKVTSLYAKNGSNEVGFTDKEGTWVDGSMILPIPLVPEILEKNGIKLQIGPGGLYQGTIEGLNVKIYFNIIEYVHELQHALRLCGIDKEIIL